MQVKTKFSPAEHVEWLRTMGHWHRDTIKLIEEMKALLEEAKSGGWYAAGPIDKFLERWEGDDEQAKAGYDQVPA